MKKRAIKRALSLLLTVLMIMSVVGCAKKSASIETSDSSDGQAYGAMSASDVDAVVSDMPAELFASTSSTSSDTITFDQLEDYTIVYYNSAYAKLCAERIQAAIKAKTGAELTMTTDAAAETDKEILVGKTNRDESEAVRSTYARPNVCYDIKVDGTKLVVMAEGYKTLEYAAGKIEKYMSDNTKTAFVGSVYDCDISPVIDNMNISMFNRAEGTDLRVFHWNMAAVLITLGGDYKNYADVDTDAKRAEIIADIVIQYNPDIITTNEIYYGHNSKLYPPVMKELSEYYTLIGDPELDGSTLDEMTSASSKTQYQKSTTGHASYDESKDQPIVGAYGAGKVSIPENILYKKDSGIEFIYSGWSYLKEYEEGKVNSNNLLGRVYYHGYHTAVFKTSDGQHFAVSVGHYQDNLSKDADTTNHIASITKTITTAKAIDSGVTNDIPTIVTGDMYTSYTTSKSNGYKAWVTAGYSDAQRNATVNANGNISHGTFHMGGVREIGRISEDFIWYKNNITALCFKVLTSMEIDDCSDHYPVMADLKFAE